MKSNNIKIKKKNEKENIDLVLEIKSSNKKTEFKLKNSVKLGITYTNDMLPKIIPTN